jgi:hypothetical protein
MRATVRVAWRVAGAAAFAATAALAVTLTRGTPLHAALTSSRNTASVIGATAGGRPARAGLPQCAPARLDVSIESLGAAAARVVTAHSDVRFPVDFTNTSGSACTLSGFPQVSAYRAGGAQVGNAAALDTSVRALRVVLAAGATAHAAVVDSASAGRCRPVAVAGLRVVPPGQSVPRYVRHAMTACSAAGLTAPVFLHVRPVQPGTGIQADTQTGRAGARHEHHADTLRSAA